MIIIGAVIMLLCIIRFIKKISLIKSIQTKKNKHILLFVKIHILLMIFFFIGYLLVGYSFCNNLSIVSETFVGMIFLFGAVFVFLGINIQDVLIDHVQKMVAIGQLASGIAHELNNPITAILGFAQCIKKEI